MSDGAARTHTPGPWEIESYEQFVGSRNGGTATAWQVKRPGASPVQFISEADARLIAAAPDLLAAAEAVDAVFRNSHLKHGEADALIALHAAILKATADERGLTP